MSSLFIMENSITTPPSIRLYVDSLGTYYTLMLLLAGGTWPGDRGDRGTGGQGTGDRGIGKVRCVLEDTTNYICYEGTYNYLY